MVLWQVHEDNGKIPLDAELFVASQPPSDGPIDPWQSLADPEAGRRYTQRVRKIVRLLRKELRSEIRRVEREVLAGASLCRVVGDNNPRFSPLGLFIAAYRLGRPDVADRLRSRAVLQHQRCPLYRWAASPLLSPEFYPNGAPAPQPELDGSPVPPRKIASLN
jgi:hypothetical protein